MGRLKPLSDDLRCVLVCIYHVSGLSVKDIVDVTGVNKWTIQRVLKHAKSFGEVGRPCHANPRHKLTYEEDGNFLVRVLVEGNLKFGMHLQANELIATTIRQHLVTH